MSRRVVVVAFVIGISLLLAGQSSVYAQAQPPASAPQPSSYNDFMPSWGKDNMLFASNRSGTFEIYMQDHEGNVGLVASTPDDDYWPRWSPDYMQFAWVSCAKDTCSLWNANADGKNPRQLAQQVSGTSSITWLGTEIIYSAQPTDKSEDLFAVDTQHGKIRQVTNTPALDEEDPSVGPDGALYMALHSDKTQQWQIYTLNGDQSERLVSLLGNTFMPTVSSRGQLAFVEASRGVGAVIVYQVEGGQFVHIPGTSMTDYFPSWSPDGTQLAFASLAQASARIFTYAVDGEGAPVCLTCTAEETKPEETPPQPQPAATPTSA